MSEILPGRQTGGNLVTWEFVESDVSRSIGKRKARVCWEIKFSPNLEGIQSKKVGREISRVGRML